MFINMAINIVHRTSFPMFINMVIYTVQKNHLNSVRIIQMLLLVCIYSVNSISKIIPTLMSFNAIPNALSLLMFICI